MGIFNQSIGFGPPGFFPHPVAIREKNAPMKSTAQGKKFLTNHSSPVNVYCI
jgi:hypothetical protein